MTKILLVTDSTASLPAKIIQKHNIQVIPVELVFENKKEIVVESFDHPIKISDYNRYTKLKKLEPKVKLPVLDKIIDFFKQKTADYSLILSIHTSHEISPMLSSVQRAIGMMAEETGKEFIAIDSKTFGPGLGFVVYQAAKIIQNESDKETILEKISEVIEHTKIILAVHRVKHILRGGLLKNSITKIQKGVLRKKSAIIWMESGIFFGVGSGSLKKIIRKIRGTLPIILDNISSKEVFLFSAGNIPKIISAKYFADIENLAEEKNLVVKQYKLLPITLAHLGRNIIGIVYYGELDNDWFLD